MYIILAGPRENHGIFYSQAWSFEDIHVKIEQTTTQGRDLTMTQNVVFREVL